MTPLEPAIAALMILTVAALLVPTLLGYRLTRLASWEEAIRERNGKRRIDYDAPALQPYLGRVLRGPSAAMGVAYILTILSSLALLPALSAGKSLLIVLMAFGTGIAVRILIYLAIQCWATIFVRRLDPDNDRDGARNEPLHKEKT